MYGAPGADWRPWIFFLFPHQQIFCSRKMTKKNIEFTETVSERTAIYVLSSRCCRKTKNLLKVSSGGLGRTVFQSLNSSGILSSSSRSGPLRLGDPLLQPWTCNTRWLCWDTDLWVNLTPSKKPTPPPPQSQLPSVGYCLSEFLINFL